MKEVDIIETKELVKPKFKNEIEAKITGISKIEDNIQEVKDYALKLSKYYSLKQFGEATTKEARKEMAEVNKFKEKVSRFRIDIEKKWKEPLNKFISEAKETEIILKETHDTINNQIAIYETKQKQEKEESVKAYFYEYCESKKIDFVNYEQTNINVTLSASMKSLKEQAKSFIDKIVDDINLINSQQYIDEITIEYKKDLNVSRAITEVNNRHAELERVQQEKEAKKEQQLTDEVMLNKIESLSAPKVEKVDKLCETEITRHYRGAFVVETTSVECFKEIKEVVRKYNSTIKNLVEDGGIYHE